MGLGENAGPGGGPGTARRHRVRLPPGNQWAGGRGRPGKGKGKRPAGAAGSAQPSPPRWGAGRALGRCPPGWRAAGGGGTPGRGGAGRRPQHAAEGPNAAAADTPWVGGTGPLPARRCLRARLLRNAPVSRRRPLLLPRTPAAVGVGDSA